MAEKDQKPTPRRLRKAREQGDVVRSPDVASAVVFIGLSAALAAGGALLFTQVRALFDIAMIAVASHDPGAQLPSVTDAMRRAWMHLTLAVSGLAGVLGVAGAFVQVGGLMAWGRLRPDLGRLNPAEGLKRMFSMRNLVQLGKMILKTLCLALVLFVVIRGAIQVPVQAGYLQPLQILVVAGKLVLILFGWSAVVFAVIAGLDYVHEHVEFIKRQRMSVEEIRREYKETEGDPHITARRRSMAREVLFSVMEERIRNASAVVYSPSRAVVLLYTGAGTLPRVVVRGEGEVAVRIREQAERNLVPAVANTGLTDKIFERIPLDQPIDRALFREVSEVLHWAEGHT